MGEIGKVGKIGYRAYSGLVLLLCLLPLAGMAVRPTTETTENTELASLPRLYGQDGWNEEFLSDLGEYFTDHFAFRQELVTADARLRGGLFSTSPVDSVIVGKDGWLYYEATLDDFQHNHGVSDRMLFNIAHNVALMQEYAHTLGQDFVFTIAPNKNSLYGEHMPNRYRKTVARQSDVERLVPYLEAEGVNYLDLYAVFRRQGEVLYFARDSQRNQKGALLAYNALLDAAQVPHEDYARVEPALYQDYYGDLGKMLYPVGGEAETRQDYGQGEGWNYTAGADVEDTYIQTVRTVSPSGDPSTEENRNLLMYRDSFGNSLLPFFARAFSKATFSKQVPYPMTDLVTSEADLVIVEKVERHLPTLGEVPPLMSGPARDPAAEASGEGHSQGDVSAPGLPAGKASAEGASTGDSGTTALELSKEGSYWKFSGIADSAFLGTDGRILLEVDDGTGGNTYEAFCVSASRDGVSSDYGYTLYVSSLLLQGEEFHVKVMSWQGGRLTVLLDSFV